MPRTRTNGARVLAEPGALRAPSGAWAQRAARRGVAHPWSPHFAPYANGRDPGTPYKWRPASGRPAFAQTALARAEGAYGLPPAELDDDPENDGPYLLDPPAERDPQEVGA